MQKSSIVSWFEDIADTYQNKTAISFFRGHVLETQLLFPEFHNDINKFINYISRYDIQDGDRVILMLEKSIFFMVAYFALLKTGVVVVPIKPGFQKKEK